MMKTLVAIVTFNAMNWIDRCLNTLFTSTIPLNVIVVDNGSIDGTQDYVRKHFPEVEMCQSKENLGFGRANNIGLQKALDEGYDYVYLLNQDAWVEPDTIQVLIEMQKKYPEYGILSPMQLQADKKFFDKNFLQIVIRTAPISFDVFEEALYFNRVSDIYEVDFVMAAHWLISRKCLETVGGFSPTFPHYGEDDNYIQRCQYWGFKVGIVPAAKAVHDRAQRITSKEKRMYLDKYIDALKRSSAPLNPIHVNKFIKAYLHGGLMGNDKYLRNYAIRLFKERKEILLNREISIKQHAAFLNLTND